MLPRALGVSVLEEVAEIDFTTETQRGLRRNQKL